MKSKLGIIAFALVVVGFIITLAGSMTFGIIVYAVGLVIAAVDIIKKYKEESLAPREFIQVSFKENLFSSIAVISILIFPEVCYYATLNSIV